VPARPILRSRRRNAKAPETHAICSAAARFLNRAACRNHGSPLVAGTSGIDIKTRLLVRADMHPALNDRLRAAAPIFCSANAAPMSCRCGPRLAFQ